jgi:hypothetical protein
LPGSKGNHPAGGNRDFFTSLGVAPRTLALVAQIEVSEAGQLHLLVVFEAGAYLLEEELNNLLGFPVVEPQLFKQAFGHFRFCQGGHFSRLPNS